MKKYMIILAVLATALSCAKEASIENDAQKGSAKLVPMTFTVSCDTKAVLNNDGLSVSFSAGDEIAIFANGNKHKFTTLEGGATAVFTGTGEVADTYYALFPYSEDAGISEGTITGVNLGTSNTVTQPGSFAPKHAIFVAKSDDFTLEFKSVVALLKLTVPESVTDLKDVAVFNRTLTPLTDAAISGTFNVTPGDGAPTVVVTERNGDAETPHTSGIVAPSESYLASGDYYIPVLPATLTKGLDMKLTYSDFIGRSANGTAFTLAAGSVYNLGTVKKINGHVYNSFEGGVLNETITGGNTSSCSVVDNPLKNGNNSSNKVMKLDMTTRSEGSGTSGVIKINPINTTRFPQTFFRTFFTKIQIKFYAAGDVYCPYGTIDADQGKGYSEIRPSRINGVTFSSEDEYINAFKTDDWNILEWDYSSIGVDNNSKKQNMVNFQFRLFVNYAKANQSRPTKQLLCYIDDIAFLQ